MKSTGSDPQLLASPKRQRRGSDPVLYFDCSSGASGDMLLAALLDLGDARGTAQALTRALRLPSTTVRLRRIAVRSLAGLQCQVRTREPRARSLRPFIARVQRSRLPPAARRRAIRALQHLTAAERRVHRGSPHAEHVDELGRLDTLVAVSGCMLAMHRLGLARAYVGPIPLGSGWAHPASARLPNPGPAVLELLRGLPVRMTRLPQELVTPTGAAILKVMARPMPPEQPCVVERIGYGFGTRRVAGRVGCVRACVVRLGPAPASRGRA